LQQNFIKNKKKQTYNQLQEMAPNIKKRTKTKEALSQVNNNSKIAKKYQEIKEKTKENVQRETQEKGKNEEEEMQEIEEIENETDTEENLLETEEQQDIGEEGSKSKNQDMEDNQEIREVIDKGKGKEDIDEENISDEDLGRSSSEENFSDQEKWRVEVNAKRYKAWIKTETLEGKGTKEKADKLAGKIGQSVKWITISKELNKNDKKLYTTLTFSNKGDMEKALTIELPTKEQGKMTKMERAPISQTRTQRNVNTTVKVWDVPIKYSHQDINRMISNQFGQIKGTRMRINGLYATYWIDFKNEQRAHEILAQKSILLGEEYLRVTHADITYKMLTEQQKTCPTAKIVGIPPGMTPENYVAH